MGGETGTGEVIHLTTRDEIRNYNVGLLLAKLRPLSKARRAEFIEELRLGPWGVFLAAIREAQRQAGLA